MTDSASDSVSGAVAAALGTSANGTFYVGYSGGLDSSVLLHAARGLYPQRVVALHVNHGLHAQADAWQRHCAEVCRNWRVELISRQVTLAGGNVEAAARAARYAFFVEMLNTDDVLLLAHHQDDQAETVLLRLVQGRGLIGMPAQRPLGRGRLARPLLGMPRATLADYASGHGLKWVEDPTNADVSLDRNYLRARVMPALRERWPDVGRALEGILAERRSVDEMLLAGLDGQSASLAISVLGRGSAVANAELLRVWLLARHAVAPSSRALRNFLAQLDAPADRQPSLALNDGSLRRYRQRIYHVPPPPRLEASYALDLPGRLALPHGVVEVGGGGAGGFTPAGAVRVVFPSNRAQCADGLLLRGHRHDLKKLLQDAHVPPWERSCYPLLVDAMGIVAVPGLAYRDIDPETQAERWEASWHPHVH